MVEEANVGIQYAKYVWAMEKEVNKLKIKDSMNDKDIQLRKLHFERMKAGFFS